MKRILKALGNVNTLEKVNLKRWGDEENARAQLSVCTQLWRKAINKSEFEFIRIGEKEVAVRYKDREDGGNCKKCPCNCPFKYREAPCEKKDSALEDAIFIGTEEELQAKKERVRARRKRPRFTTDALMHNRVPNDIELRADVGAFMNERPLVVTRLHDKVTCFPGMRKGDGRYNMKTYWEIHDKCMFADATHEQAYFLTLTEDAKRFGGTLHQLWQEHVEHVKRFVKELQRSKNFSYVRVVESQLNGNPHSHVVIWRKKKDPRVKQRYSPAQKHSYVYAGEVHELRVKFWEWGHSDLQLSDQRGTANYVAKYVAKQTEADFYTALVDGIKNDSQKKELYGVFFAKSAQIRSYSSSRLTGWKEFAQKHVAEWKAEKKGENALWEKRVLPLPASNVAGERSERNAPAKRAYLIKLSNNLPNFPCEREVWRVPRELAKMYSNESTNALAVTEEFTSQVFHSLNYRMCGGGSVVSHFKELKRLGVDDWFSRKERGLTENEAFAEFKAFSAWASRAPRTQKEATERMLQKKYAPKSRNFDKLSYRQLELCDYVQKICDIRVSAHFCSFGDVAHPLAGTWEEEVAQPSMRGSEIKFADEWSAPACLKWQTWITKEMLDAVYNATH